MRGACPDLLVFAVTALLILAESVVADQQPLRGRALLVGCTTYDHLEPSMHLQGPANDVLLMRDLLCNRFSFKPEGVVILAEFVGKPNLRPTRANIEREFHRLGREAESGEQIVIFLAGHGSQQPVLNPSPDNPEPDGLDELFLPADVQGWDLGIGKVPNAIIDDELQIWLREIEKRHAMVTIIVDSCHSGGMTRGVGERVRQIPPGVLVPLDVLANAQPPTKQAIVRGGHEQSRTDQSTDFIVESSQVIAVYASQSSEATIEKLLPSDGLDRKPYGLLTFTMNQVLSRSSRPLTYRELVQQIQKQYLGAGRSFPTPMIEGMNRDRELFGAAEWPNRSQIELNKTARGWTINAGMLQGITQGSVFSVFAAVGKDTMTPQGYVRVQLARTIESEVIPCDFEGLALERALPDAGRCEIAFLDAGDLRLRVAISALGASTDADWVKRLKAIASPKSPAASRLRLVQFVEEVADADWLVQVRERDVIVVPAESAVMVSGMTPNTAFGPSPLNEATVEWLTLSLERIARAANLKKLAANENAEAQVDDGVHIELKIERADVFSKNIAERMTLRDGEHVTIRLQNPCRFPVDVTLLSIDTGCGISAVFPARGEINRLQPGDSIPLSTKIVATSRGLEHILAIVVKSHREVVDFTSLAQPSLEMIKTRGGQASKSLNSPFGELLKYAVFAEGETRGVKRSTINTHRLQLLSWEVEPNPAPRIEGQ